MLLRKCYDIYPCTRLALQVGTWSFIAQLFTACNSFLGGSGVFLLPHTLLPASERILKRAPCLAERARYAGAASQ